jgi:putative endonuclease
LEKRLDDHNNSRNKSTKAGKPWVIKWFKEFETRSEAIKEENRLKKKKSRKYLEYLVEQSDRID